MREKLMLDHFVFASFTFCVNIASLLYKNTRNHNSFRNEKEDHHPTTPPPCFQAGMTWSVVTEGEGTPTLVRKRRCEPISGLPHCGQFKRGQLEAGEGGRQHFAFIFRIPDSSITGTAPTRLRDRLRNSALGSPLLL